MKQKLIEMKKTVKKEEANNDQRTKIIDSLINGIERKFGKGSIQILGRSKKIDIEAWPTGLLSVDYVCGVGGFPKGRIVEIFGPEAVGKTTLALHAIAEAQKQGHYAAFIDAEHAFGINYSQSLGVDLNKLIFNQPDYAEQALDIAEQIARSGAVSIIVIDSVAALVPLAEIEGNFEDQQVGLQARLMSKAMRKLAAALAKTNTTCIFINQLRMKIGSYGNPETTTGGNALKFYSSLRLELKPAAKRKDKDGRLIGGDIKITAVKNKVANPYKTRIVPLLYGKGFEKKRDLVYLGLDLGLIDKSASWFEYKGIRAQGIDNFINQLTDESIKQLTQEIFKTLKE